MRLIRLARTNRHHVVVVFCLLCVLSGEIGVTARQVAATSFEVASVRANKTSADIGLGGGVQALPGGRVLATGLSLRNLIAYAYGLDTMYERVEGRSELLDQYFDITAKAPTDVMQSRYGTVGPLNVMLQNLLRDRFKLSVRFDERFQPGYALVRAGEDRALGPRLRVSDLQCPRPAGVSKAIEDNRSCAIRTINGELTANGNALADFARALSTLLRQPVSDRTGLSGSYQIQLTFDAFELAERAGLRPAAPESVRSRLPSLFTALQEQLGLKLEAVRVPARALIVERVEPPSEN